MGADAADGDTIDRRLGEIMERLDQTHRSLAALREDLREGAFDAPGRPPDVSPLNLVRVQYRPQGWVWTAEISAPGVSECYFADSPAGALLRLATALVLDPGAWQPEDE